MKTVVATATLNEIENIALLVGAIHRLYPDFHILVVDDNSPDGTGRRLEELREEIPVLTVEHRPGRLGLGSAHQLAMLHALRNGYDRLVTMDADLSHDPADIARLLAKLDGNDFVIGSRYMKGGACEYQGYRKWISQIANIAARLLLGIPLHEFTTSFRAFRVPALARVNYQELQTRGYSFFMEVVAQTARAGLRMAEIPIIFHDRFGGESKISRNEIYAGMIKLLILAGRRLFRRPAGSYDHPTGEACPFCASPDQVEVHPRRPQAATAAPAADAAAYRCTSLFHRSNPRVLKCLRCGLIYVPASEQPPDLEGLYGDVEDARYLEIMDSRRRTFAQAFRQVMAWCPGKPGKLFEIGAYCGLFLQEARRHGWACDGVEPSRWAARYARDMFDLPVRPGLLADYAAALPADHDLVVSWDVLEHVRDPVAFLTEANRLLKPGGLIALSTLDYSNWFPRLAGRRWPWLMDMHLFYFTPAVLEEIFRRAGFEPVHNGPYVHYASLRYIALKGLAIVGLGRLAFFARLLPKSLVVPVSFGDIKLFIARKVSAP